MMGKMWQTHVGSRLSIVCVNKWSMRCLSAEGPKGCAAPGDPGL